MGNFLGGLCPHRLVEEDKKVPLIERLGGEAAIEAVVDKFYIRMMKDDRVNYLFKNTDMKKQRVHQTRFLTFAFGGSNKYNGRSMRAAHAGLNLTEEHFQAVAQNLTATLKEDFNVPDHLIGEVMKVVASTHDDVLNLPPKEKPLFERLGGEGAIEAVVDKFYVRLLKDNRVNYLFKNTDMKKQRVHQARFLTFAFGGTNKYNGRSMRAAHAGLNLTEEHFQAVAEVLTATLKEDFNVPDNLIGEVMKIVASTHDDVLNLPPKDDRPLIERLGGEAAIEAVVDKFYVRMMKDNRVNYLFKNTDMKKQRVHQARFLTFAFGGTNKYNGRSMRAAHAGLNLTEEHFQAVAQNLSATLKEDFNVPDNLIGEVMKIVASTHDDVLCLPPKEEKPLIERLGGEGAIEAVVDKFYVRLLKDNRVNYLFKNTDMKKQRVHQARFLTFAFGGTNKYNGRSMRAAHAGLNLTEEHFQAVAEVLSATLKEDFNVPDNLIGEVMKIVASTHDDVLNLPAKSS